MHTLRLNGMNYGQFHEGNSFRHREIITERERIKNITSVNANYNCILKPS